MVLDMPASVRRSGCIIRDCPSTGVLLLSQYRSWHITTCCAKTTAGCPAAAGQLRGRAHAYQLTTPAMPAIAVHDGGMTKSAKEFAKSVLQQSHILSKLSDMQLEDLVSRMTMQQCCAGHIIVQMGTRTKQVVVLQHGECIAAKALVDDHTTVQDLCAVGHTFMVRGDFYGEIMLVKQQKNPASIVAMCNNTIIIVLTLQDLMEVVGAKTEGEATEMLLRVATKRTDGKDGSDSISKVPFRDLTFHRVIGKGQFGSVRMASHASSDQTFALKTLYKQSISDAKQVEHITNELSVMHAIKSPFCVQVRIPVATVFPPLQPQASTLTGRWNQRGPNWWGCTCSCTGRTRTITASTCSWNGCRAASSFTSSTCTSPSMKRQHVSTLQTSSSRWSIFTPWV
jgi:CRP-like cAMP-binding protein